MIKYDGNRTGGKYWDVWGKEQGGDMEEDVDAGGVPSTSPSLPPPQDITMSDDRGGRAAPEAGPSGSSVRRRRADGPVRRMRVNALRARANASVLGELAWRVRRYERGEGGVV